MVCEAQHSKLDLQPLVAEPWNVQRHYLWPMPWISRRVLHLQRRLFWQRWKHVTQQKLQCLWLLSGSPVCFVDVWDSGTGRAVPRLLQPGGRPQPAHLHRPVPWRWRVQLQCLADTECQCASCLQQHMHTVDTAVNPRTHFHRSYCHFENGAATDAHNSTWETIEYGHRW